MYKQPKKRRRKKAELSQDQRDEIVELHDHHYGSRRIAPRVGWSRKIVSRVLHEEGCSSSRPTEKPSLLDRFRDLIQVKVKKDLTISRILREIREEGYQGGRTVLATYVRPLRAELCLPPAKKVKRRFETAMGREMQIDWSPYKVVIAGSIVTVYALGVLMCASRKLWVHFFRNERQPILLEGLACAFEYFGGCAMRCVLDNMSTAVLGRYGPDHKPIFHPTFLDFARHYGFDPFACRVRDADRKGKKEKSFRLVWDDFLKGSVFESVDELNQRFMTWLDDTPEVANQRIHGTTGVVPNVAWETERELLIPLPHKRFPVYEHRIGTVDADCSLSIAGKSYIVPDALANRSADVHLFAEHFEVLDPHQRVVYSRRYAPKTDPRKLIIDETNQATRKRRPRGDGKRLVDAFAVRFPQLGPLLVGLQLRMKGLAPVHVRALLRLAERYGEDAFTSAASRAQDYRRFDAYAVERILEHRAVPTLDEPMAPLGGVGAVLLGDVDSGSLDTYSHLDTEPTTRNDNDDTEDEDGS
jgi:transposase